MSVAHATAATPRARGNASGEKATVLARDIRKRRPTRRPTAQSSMPTRAELRAAVVSRADERKARGKRNNIFTRALGRSQARCRRQFAKCDELRQSSTKFVYSWALGFIIGDVYPHLQALENHTNTNKYELDKLRKKCVIIYIYIYIYVTIISTKN